MRRQKRLRPASQKENGVKTIAIRTDVTKPEEVNAMMEEIMSTFGRLDAAFLRNLHEHPVRDDL